MATIGADGWVTGTLKGPLGQEFTIERHECPRPNGEAYRRLEKTPADLCLHTTEGTDLDTGIATLKSKFSPPQWAVGEYRIAQLRPLWAQGASVDTQNAYLMQIEAVAKSQTTLWLPAPSTLNPLVALVAFLHSQGLITTGLARPEVLAKLPVVLDRLPAATDQYYRRFLAPLPSVDGVRGHVDLKDDEHWDPGSFDYPRFFTMVSACLPPPPPPPKPKFGYVVRKADGSFTSAMSLLRANRLIRQQMREGAEGAKVTVRKVRT